MRRILLFLLILWVPKVWGLSPAQLHHLANKFIDIYQDDPAMKEKTLSFEISDVVRGSKAFVSEKESHITIYFTKKAASHKLIDQEAFFALACHELGHKLGGAPIKEPGALVLERGSFEGQADYFATLRCLKRVFSFLDNESWLSQTKVPLEVEQICSKVYLKREPLLTCMRSILAAVSMLRVIEKDQKYDKRGLQPANLSMKSSKVAKYTSWLHPNTQCRLDIMVAGALCRVDEPYVLSDSDPTLGTCQKGPGARPKCWYRAAEFF